MNYMNRSPRCVRLTEHTEEDDIYITIKRSEEIQNTLDKIKAEEDA